MAHARAIQWAFGRVGAYEAAHEWAQGRLRTQWCQWCRTRSGDCSATSGRQSFFTAPLGAFSPGSASATRAARCDGAHCSEYVLRSLRAQLQAGSDAPAHGTQRGRRRTANAWAKPPGESCAGAGAARRTWGSKRGGARGVCTRAEPDGAATAANREYAPAVQGTRREDMCNAELARSDAPCSPGQRGRGGATAKDDPGTRRGDRAAKCRRAEATEGQGERDGFA
mmetsp:Transcript_57707/g.132487  ORF Transcript_57707/g.132487 Transcript_57707/m.132487 type:complete len:225 (-) Transcript_57707:1652-2326(-)